MAFNKCKGCGAKDGRAGIVWNTQHGEDLCENCYETVKTGSMVMLTKLKRTPEEYQRQAALLLNQGDKVKCDHCRRMMPPNPGSEDCAHCQEQKKRILNVHRGVEEMSVDYLDYRRIRTLLLEYYPDFGETTGRLSDAIEEVFERNKNK